MSANPAALKGITPYGMILPSQEEFHLLTKVLKDRAGIHLQYSEKNATLFGARLTTLIREKGYVTYLDYARILRKGEQGEINDFVSALTTNTTEFFRESAHFDILSRHLKEVMDYQLRVGRRELRVWCAAASTGQEPYTILMSLLEAAPDLKSWDLKFLATDIDLEALQKSADAVYKEDDMRNVSQILRQKYFRRRDQGKGVHYVLRPEFRSMIRFAPLNLVSGGWPFQHAFNIVFCRNVLIYFERETAEKVVNRIADAMRPGALLFLGHAETVVMRCPSLVPISHAAYQKRKG